MRGMAALALVWLILAQSAAQEAACPALQNQALASLAEHCAEIEAGAFCYGHATVTPVLRNVDAAGRFAQPGDKLAIAAIDWLSLSSEDKTWGVARAQFATYAEADLEARSAALLAFGNVALFFPAPAAQPAAFVAIQVTAAQGANLRDSPGTDSRVIAQLPVSRALKAVGRAPGGGWLRVYAAPDLRGWISASVVSPPADDLPTLDASAEALPLWRSGQRFAFLSGIGDAPCPGAPASGILLQTPKTSLPRYFEINGARLNLSGVAWLQAQLSSGMRVHVLDGRARLATDEGAATLAGGKFTTVALERGADGALRAAGAPASAEAYVYHALVDLPVGALPQPAKVGLDVYTVVAPAPAGGSPLDGLPGDSPCKFSAGLSGANIRAGPDPAAPIIAVMAYRESARPIARAIGVDRLPWWKLADSVWVRVDATVSGGACNDVPLIRLEA